MIKLESLGLKPDSTLVAGVSGGADSLTLLHLLRRSNRPVICASFNHRLRPESDAEIAHVREIAERLGVLFITDSADVAGFAAEKHLSIEEAARSLRYRFLFRVAREHKAAAVAVAHTADDQAETVLMHFIRGAGLAGLKGMTPRTLLPVFDPEIPLLRPILHLSRAQTEAYCREHGLGYVEDPSNRDTTYFRNRLRHELLPVLESYNPKIREVLARTAHTLQGDHDLLTELVDKSWEDAVIDQGAGYVAFDYLVLKILSIPMRRNLFKRAAFQLRPGLRDIDFDALERAAELHPGITDLAGGLRVFEDGELFYLADKDAELAPLYWPQLPESLDLSVGFWPLSGDWVLEVFKQADERIQAEALENCDPFMAWFDADLMGDRLQLRSPRMGETFEPLGMPGKQVKLSDFFINHKIPQRARKKWPLVCAGDQVIWVAGLRMSHPFRVTGTTRTALRLSLRRL